MRGRKQRRTTRTTTVRRRGKLARWITHVRHFMAGHYTGGLYGARKASALTCPTESRLTNLHVGLLHGSDRVVVSVRLRCRVTGLMMIMVMMLTMMMIIGRMLLPPPLSAGTGILDRLLADLAPSYYSHATYFFLKHIPTCHRAGQTIGTACAIVSLPLLRNFADAKKRRETPARYSSRGTSTRSRNTSRAFRNARARGSLHVSSRRSASCR